MVKIYVIIVYDIKTERVNKVKSFLRQYLNWVQNSVFEGELTKSEYQKVKEGLKKIINENEDAIKIYKQIIGEPEIEIIGIEKAPINDII